MMIIAADRLEAAPLVVDNELARRDHSSFISQVCLF